MMSLPPQSQEAVIAKGTVLTPGVRNSSALLMARIREVDGAWVSLSPVCTVEVINEHSRSDRLFGGLPPQDSIIVFVRGEGNRKGGRTEHFTIRDFANFEANMASIQHFVVRPILDGGNNKVYVMGDVKTFDEEEDEVRSLMKQAFGSAFIDVRAQSCLFGLDQVGSLMSSWDTFRHWCNQRAFLGEVKGVYFLRADVALLSEGLHQWPRDRLCFLWNTFCQKLGPNCVNDIIFYVPSTLFHCFREALSQAKEDHMPTGHLHWLSLCPALADLGRSCVARIQLDAPGEHIQDS